MSDNQEKLIFLQNKLDLVSKEVLSLISKYNLSVSTPMEIIDTAKKNITDEKDYLRFIELSLEGRIISETFEHIQKAIENE